VLPYRSRSEYTEEDRHKILFAQNFKTGVKLDDVRLIDDLRAISDDAANRYLEHVVIAKRSPSRQLHEALLAQLLDEAADLVEDDGVKYHLEELGMSSFRIHITWLTI